MKKFLTMFAFAAAIVFGAFTLASCGDDEDGPNATHRFTLGGEFKSNLASVRENPEFKKDCDAALNELIPSIKNLGKDLTDTQAAMVWAGVRDDLETRELIQKTLDRVATKYKDRTLTLTIIVMRDGAKWQGAEWTTTYKDEWYN